MGYLDAMYELVKKCKLMARVALEEGEREREKQLERERRGSVSTGIGGRTVRGPRGDGGVALAAMWRERGSRMALIIASQFIEMKVGISPHCSQVSNRLVCITRGDVSPLPNIRSSQPQHASLPHFALHPLPNCVLRWEGYTSKLDSSTRH